MVLQRQKEKGYLSITEDPEQFRINKALENFLQNSSKATSDKYSSSVKKHVDVSKLKMYQVPVNHKIKLKIMEIAEILKKHLC